MGRKGDTIFRAMFLLLVILASDNVRAEELKWGSVKDLSAAVQSSGGPQIALSSSGMKAIAVWNSSPYPSNYIKSSSATISNNTAVWKTNTTNLSSYGAGQSQIALSSDGTKATAIWVVFNYPNYFIRSASATINDNTITWGTVTTLSVGTGKFPQIALSSDGSMATAVWAYDDGSKYIIQTKSATINGNTATWNTNATDLSDSGQAGDNPQITLSSDGTRATAVWVHYANPYNRVQSRSATIDGGTVSWGTAQYLSETGYNTADPQIRLSIGGDKATVVWDLYDSVHSAHIIQSASATISGNIASWGTVTDLTQPGGDASPLNPQVALSSNGAQAVAIWPRFDGSNTIIQAKSAKITGSTAAWGAVRDMSAAGQNAYSPRIALSSDGKIATAIWSRSNGSNTTIQSVIAFVDDDVCFVIKAVNGNVVNFCL